MHAHAHQHSPEIPDLYHPVFAYGLQLKARLDAGERPVFDAEQGVLKGLLLSDTEARRWSSYGGDTGPAGLEAADGARRGTPFLGVRYALVCWLDELFTLDSPWQGQWNEHKLEVALYGTNDRAWKFWDQARQAESRPESDALEVFFLCVMLGFAGELRDDPQRLQTWLTAAQTRVTRARGREWQPPAELDPPMRVAPLRGRERLQRLLVVSAAALLCLIPVLAFVVVQNIAN